MDFIQNIDSGYLAFGLFIVFLIGHFIVQREKSIKLTLQYRLISYVIVIGFITLSIPHVFPGWFKDVSDLETKKLLYHLKRNHEALVKTTEAIRTIFFVTLIFAFSVILPIIKHFKLEKATN
ncbi:hypothetical protein [Flavobacterium sp.]